MQLELEVEKLNPGHTDDRLGDDDIDDGEVGNGGRILSNWLKLYLETDFWHSWSLINLQRDTDDRLEGDDLDDGEEAQANGARIHSNWLELPLKTDNWPSRTLRSLQGDIGDRHEDDDYNDEEKFQKTQA